MRGGHNKTPDDVRLAALAAVRGGESCAGAAKRLGLSGSTVRRLCHEAGVEVMPVGWPKGRPRSAVADDVTRRAARALVQQATPYDEIIKQTGLPRSTVRAIVVEEEGRDPGLRRRYIANRPKHWRQTDKPRSKGWNAPDFDPDTLDVDGPPDLFEEGWLG